MPQSSIQVHGHRGSRGTHTENTFAAMEEAARVGVHSIEIDVHQSKDNVPVVYHDPVLSGRLCLDSSGQPLKKPISLREIEAKDLNQFRLGSYVHPRFPNQTLIPNQRIPLLADVLEWQKKHKEIQLNIELKTRPMPYSSPIDIGSFAQAVVDVIERFGAWHISFIQSFDFEILKAIESITDKATLCLLFSDDRNFFERVIQSGFSKVTLYHRILKEKQVKALHQLGIAVLTYTVNTESDWKRAIEKGVDGIITDYPGKLLQFLSESH